ncbi:MAG: hypothetical protein Q8865_01080 [Bacillota bacterium]|nr:hypothetical protein [Bacillota bacterium]
MENNFIVELNVDTALFYTKIASYAGLPVEKVLSDALFKLAGELSLRTFKQNKQIKMAAR